MVGAQTIHIKNILRNLFLDFHFPHEVVVGSLSIKEENKTFVCETLMPPAATKYCYFGIKVRVKARK